MDEKRNNYRLKVNMKVDYRDDTHGDMMGRVIDISKSGMYVHTGYRPDVKGSVKASLDAEDFGKVIWVEGRVVWKSRTGMAVTFTNIDKKGLINLLTYKSASF